MEPRLAESTSPAAWRTLLLDLLRLPPSSPPRSLPRGLPDCLTGDGPRVVSLLRALARLGAVQPEQAGRTLAYAAKRGDERTRSLAFAALDAVCPDSLSLFFFASAVDQLGGWGRGTRRAVARWYLDRPPRDVVSAALAAPGGAGWTHRDLLCLSHPEPRTAEEAHLLRWLARGVLDLGAAARTPALDLAGAAEAAGRTRDPHAAAALIRDSGLPLTAVPPPLRARPEVLAAHLGRLDGGELLRALPGLADSGLLAPLRLGAHAAERVARGASAAVDPLQVFVALESCRRQPDVDPELLAALEGLFAASLVAAEPLGRRWLVAMDVSPSMASARLPSLPGVSARRACAAIGLWLAGGAAERLLAFTSDRGGARSLEPLRLPTGGTLDMAERALAHRRFGAADLRAPLAFIEEHDLEVELILVITDSDACAAPSVLPEADKLVVWSLAGQSRPLGDRALQLTGLDPRSPAILRALATLA